MDPYFILPLLMGASTYLMQALNPQVGDPMQVRMMKLMPILFTVLFLFFPAGLVLYWLINNLLSLAQQTYVYRQNKQAAKSQLADTTNSSRQHGRNGHRLNCAIATPPGEGGVGIIRLSGPSAKELAQTLVSVELPRRALYSRFMANDETLTMASFSGFRV